MENALLVDKPVVENQETCLICYVDFTPKDMSSPLKCSHKFCLDCFKGYFEGKMQAFQVLNIKCPQDGCTEVFTNDHIKSILAEDRFTRYQELVIKKQENTSGYKRFCPKPDCSRPIVLKPMQQHYTCACGTQLCQKCLTIWHPGKPCPETLDSNLDSFTKNSSLKPCPMCKTPVMKDGGCPSMTCPVCDYIWCWTCGQPAYLTHICPKKWSPFDPPDNSFETKMKRGFRMLKLVICLTLFWLIMLPLFCLIVVVFWPAAIDSIKKKLSWKKKCKSSMIMFLVGIFGIVILPFTLIYLFCASIYLIIVFIIQTKKKGFKYWLNHRQPRWKSGEFGPPRAQISRQKSGNPAKDVSQKPSTDTPSTSQPIEVAIDKLNQNKSTTILHFLPIEPVPKEEQKESQYQDKKVMEGPPAENIKEKSMIEPSKGLDEQKGSDETEGPLDIFKLMARSKSVISPLMSLHFSFENHEGKKTEEAMPDQAQAYLNTNEQEENQPLEAHSFLQNVRLESESPEKMREDQGQIEIKIT